ncbi:MAG: LacI family DNA-binding transcriptional regulator [Gemmatimonadota bacterium]
MAATIRDVARAAGVSVATVSRVLNDSGPVKHETRLRIQEAAQRLHFSPNTTARSLSTRQTHTIGVLLPDLYGEFFSEIIRGIDQTIQSKGFHALISSSHNDASEVEAALRAMRGRVDGLILMASGLEAATLARILPERTATVLINANYDGARYDTLDIDNFNGARDMTLHLLQLGHREIRMIRGAAGHRDASEREAGFRAALDQHGVVMHDHWIVPGEFTEASGFRATQQLLSGPIRPTAIFAANDSMAVGALSALREAGLWVPEDVAVVGFDDISIAEYVSPPLTTVRVSTATLGAGAADRLFDAINAHNRHERKREVLPTELAIRSSCGATLSQSTQIRRNRQ